MPIALGRLRRTAMGLVVLLSCTDGVRSAVPLWDNSGVFTSAGIRSTLPYTSSSGQGPGYREGYISQQSSSGVIADPLPSDPNATNGPVLINTDARFDRAFTSSSSTLGSFDHVDVFGMTTIRVAVDTAGITTSSVVMYDLAFGFQVSERTQYQLDGYGFAYNGFYSGILATSSALTVRCSLQDATLPGQQVPVYDPYGFDYSTAGEIFNSAQVSGSGWLNPGRYFFRFQVRLDANGSGNDPLNGPPPLGMITGGMGLTFDVPAPSAVMLAVPCGCVVMSRRRSARSR